MRAQSLRALSNAFWRNTNGGLCETLQHAHQRRFAVRAVRAHFESIEEASAVANALRECPNIPDAARRLLDLDILESMSESRAKTNEIFREALSNEPCDEARHEVAVAFSLLIRRAGMLGICCPECLQLNARCVCNLVRKTAPTCARLYVLQNVGEYGRPNNTGSLLCVIAGATRVVRGMRSEQAQMLRDLEKDGSEAVVLFPRDGSLSLKEYVKERERRTRKKNTDNLLNVVVLDGTSRQAKNLDRFMPQHLPRVRLDHRQIASWLHPIRKQTEAHRVCTAQAAAVFLGAVGEADCADAIEHAVRAVVDSVVRDRLIAGY